MRSENFTYTVSICVKLHHEFLFIFQLVIKEENKTIRRPYVVYTLSKISKLL